MKAAIGAFASPVAPTGTSLLGPPVADQLHGPQAADAAHVPDAGVPRGERAQPRPEYAPAETVGRIDGALVLHGADRPHRSRARERMAAVGHPRGIGPLGERPVDRIAHEHAAEGHVAGVHALGEHQQVRRHALVVDREPGPGSAEPDQHLVGDQQDAMAGAQLPHPAQVPGRWTFTPELPVTGSSTSAAIVVGPSSRITCSRCARARSHSSSGVPTRTRSGTGKGPKKCTTPAVPVSEAQRRGSPVRWIEVVVEPW